MAQIEGSVKINVNANQAEQEMRKLEAKASELRQEIIKISKQEWVDKKQLKVLHQELRAVEKEQRELKKSAWNYKKVLDNLSGASLRDLNKAYRQLNFELSKLERGTEEWKRKASELAKVKSEIGSVRQKMRELENGTKKSNGWLDKLVSGFNKFGGVALTAIAGVTATLTGLVQVMKGMLNTMSEWEDSFTDVLTLMSGDEVEKFGKKLEEGAIEVMKKYGLATRDVNKALFDTVSAGVDAAHSIDVLNAAAELAIGGTTELSVATDGLTTIINAFHLSTKEAGEVADAFFSAQKYGKTTVEELASSVGKVAPMMNAAGLSYQETLAALAELTKNGISTAEATTYLKGAISSLLKPTKEAEKVLREYGVPVGATEIKQAGLTKTLERFNEMMEKNPDVVAKAMPNLEGMTAIMSLTGDSFEDFKVILEAVNNDVGEGSSLMEAYGIKTNTMAFKMKQSKAEMRGSIVELKDSLGPFLMSFHKGITSITRGLSNFFRNNMDLFRDFAQLIKFIFTKLLPIKQVLKDIGAIIRIQIFLYRKIKEEIKALIKRNEDLINSVRKFWKKVTDWLNPVIEKYKQLRDFWSNLAETIGATKVEAEASVTTTEVTEVVRKTKKDETKDDKKNDKKLTEEELEKIRQDTEKLREIIDNYRRGLISDAEARAREEVEAWKKAEEERIATMVANERVKGEARAALQELYEKKMTDISNRYAAEREKKIEEINNFLEEQEQKLHKTREELIAAEIQHIAEKYDKEIRLAEELAEKNPELREAMLEKIEELERLKTEEITGYKKQKEEELEAAKLQIREKYGLVDDKERMEMELEQLEEYYQQKLLTDEEYEQAKAGIREKYRLKDLEAEKKAEKEKEKIYKKSLSSSMQMLNYLSDFVEANKKEELSRAEYTEEEKKKIAKRYANIELAITISKIVATTGQAIMQAYAQLGPVAGTVAAFLIGSTGALQIAAATNEKNKIQGYEEGGLWDVVRAQDGKSYKAGIGRDRGLITRPTILVAEEGPEYVIPNEGLENKHILNFVLGLEQARKAGQLRNFEPPSIRGYAEGGSTGTIEIKGDNTGYDELSIKMDILIGEFSEFSSKIDNWASNLKVDYYSFREADQKITNIEKGEEL